MKKLETIPRKSHARKVLISNINGCTAYSLRFRASLLNGCGGRYNMKTSICTVIRISRMLGTDCVGTSNSITSGGSIAAWLTEHLDRYIQELKQKSIVERIRTQKEGRLIKY